MFVIRGWMQSPYKWPSTPNLLWLHKAYRTNTSVKQHCVFAPKYLVRIREASSAVVGQETILPVCVSFVLPFSFIEYDFRCSNSDMWYEVFMCNEEFLCECLLLISLVCGRWLTKIWRKWKVRGVCFNNNFLRQPNSKATLHKSLCLCETKKKMVAYWLLIT